MDVAGIMLSYFLQGKAVILEIAEERLPVFCQLTWLSQVLTVAFNPPATSTNQTTIIGLSTDIPLWNNDDLLKAIEKTGLAAEQVS